MDTGNLILEIQQDKLNNCKLPRNKKKYSLHFRTNKASFLSLYRKQPTFAVLSAEVDENLLPSGETAQERTAPPWQVKSFSVFPVVISQTYQIHRKNSLLL